MSRRKSNKLKYRTKICSICKRKFKSHYVYNKRLKKKVLVKTCSLLCSRLYAAKVTKKLNKGFKRVYSVNDNFLSKESNAKYYLLGLLASDGYVRGKSSNIICLSQSGEEGLKIIKYVKNLLDFTGKIYKCATYRKISYGLQIVSKKLCDICKKYNIVPNKTYNYTISNSILISERKLKYFLIGYIDGDGCIGIYKNILRIGFVCTPKMASQLLKIDCFKDSLLIHKKNVDEIVFNGCSAVIFGDWLYKDISVYKSYKYNIYKKYKQQYKRIAKKSQAHYRNIQIMNYLDSIKCGITSKNLSKRFNIKLHCAENLKYIWRKQNGLSKKFNFKSGSKQSL